MNKRFYLFLLSFALFLGCQKTELSEGVPASSALTLELPGSAALALEWVRGMQAGNGLMESAEGTGFVSLYDNALAAILFTKTGHTAQARHIFDYFNNRLVSEFAQTGGGFYQFRHLSGSEPSHVWIGDNAWLLMALRHYRDTYADPTYDALIGALDHWLRSMQDTDGSLFGGTNADGTLIPKVTEGMITAYQAVSGNDAFHERLLQYLQANRWDETGSQLLAEDQPSRYANALDLHSLPALIWANTDLPFIETAEQFMTVQSHSVNGTPVSGYCFDRDLDVVWLEGTSQIALAMAENGMTAGFRETLKHLEASLVPGQKNQDTLGLPYAANQGSSYGAVSLWDHADRQAALSSTVWFVFAHLQLNPFRMDEPAKPAPSPLS
ncbi:hypothetical protein OZ410_02200 [Robiginitalea sp. M366]|uniref:hypothetical protein n=1 Tax=Robiginitalea aestuariiviva TaxID=3036903 RepID=UPI00240D409A|nr:hypothetical protein [Robiginitalea aestuariiviva]MDG1571110.1 hypothetical protein [Robiginitalea aestuariiviva]